MPTQVVMAVLVAQVLTNLAAAVAVYSVMAVPVTHKAVLAVEAESCPEALVLVVIAIKTEKAAMGWLITA